MSIMTYLYIVSFIIIVIGTIINVIIKRRNNEVKNYYVINGVKYTKTNYNNQLHSYEYSHVERGDTRVIFNSLFYADVVKHKNIFGLRSIYWSILIDERIKDKDRRKLIVDRFYKKLEDNG